MAGKQLTSGGQSSVLYIDRRDFYLYPTEYAEVFPSVNPYLVFMIKGVRQKMSPNDPVFKMFQHTNPWVRQTMSVNGTVTTIAASVSGASVESAAITFDGITNLFPTIDESFVHLVFEVWNETGTTYKGTCILTDDTTGATAKFKNLRGADIDVVNNDLFVNLSTAEEDASDSPEAWYDELETVWNQCQMFRVPVEVKGALLHASLRGANDELARLRLQKMQQFKMYQEKALLLNTSPLGTNLGGAGTFLDNDKLTGDNNDVIRTTYGSLACVRDYGSSNPTDVDQSIFNIDSATYTYSEFVDDMEKLAYFQPASGTKVGFCGPKAMGYWSKLTAEKKDEWQIHISAAQKHELGFDIRKLTTPHVELDLVRTHAMQFEYSGYMYVPSAEDTELVTYEADQFRANIKTDNAPNLVKDEYYCNKGVGITNVEKHKLFIIT